MSEVAEARTTKKQRAPAWVKGYCAYEDDVPFERCPDGAEVLRAQWREGWLQADADAESE